MKNVLTGLRNRLDRHREAARAWMAAELLPRYQQLAPREQRLLLATSVALPLLVLVFGVLLPMQDRQQALRADILTLRHQAEEAADLATTLQSRGPASRHTGHGDAMSTVERLAAQEKVQNYMTDIRPQPSAQDGKQRIMVQLKDAPYAATLRFIADLAQARLGVESLRLQEGNSPGHVHLRTVVSGG